MIISPYHEQIMSNTISNARQENQQEISALGAVLNGTPVGKVPLGGRDVVRRGNFWSRGSSGRAADLERAQTRAARMPVIAT